MAIDVYAIIENTYPAEKLVEIPAQIDTWQEVKRLMEQVAPEDRPIDFRTKPPKPSSWLGPKASMRPDILKAMWQAYQNNGYSDLDLRGFDLEVSTFFGGLKFFEKVIVITRNPEHKYANLCAPDTARSLILVNRLIARQFGQKRILYYPDGFPPAKIEDFVWAGDSFSTIEQKAVERFGPPPKGIEAGRRNMFFIDHIDDEIGELPHCDLGEGYWQYNPQTTTYERIP